MADRRSIRPSRVTEGPLVPDDDEPHEESLGEESARNEEPSDADVIRFDGDSTRCRRCKTLLYDDLDSCPRCGEAVGSPSGRKMSMWVVIVLGLVVVAMMAPFVLPVLMRLF